MGQGGGTWRHNCPCKDTQLPRQRLSQGLCCCWGILIRLKKKKNCSARPGEPARRGTYELCAVFVRRPRCVYAMFIDCVWCEAIRMNSFLRYTATNKFLVTDHSWPPWYVLFYWDFSIARLLQLLPVLNVIDIQCNYGKFPMTPISHRRKFNFVFNLRFPQSTLW